MIKKNKAKSYAVFWQLIPLLVVFLCLCIAFTAVFRNYMIRFDRALDSEIEKNLSNTAEAIADRITDLTKDTQELLKSVSEAVASLEGNRERMSYLNKIEEQYSFSYIGYAQSEGLLHATVSEESVNIRGEEYFQSALHGENNISELTLKIFKNFAVTGLIFSVPFVENEGTGALVAMMDVRNFSDILNVDNYDGAGYYYIIDRNGDIIFHSQSIDVSNLFKAFDTITLQDDKAAENFYEDVTCGRNGMLEYSEFGFEKYAYYCPAGLNGWMVVNVVPREVVAGGTIELSKQLAVIGVFMIILITILLAMALIAIYISKRRRLSTEAKSAFLANMSHEIRTPMNAIVGISEMLLRDNLSMKQQEQVMAIANSGKGLLNIINDILDISKIEAGKMKVVSEAYELEALLYEITSFMSIRIGDKAIEFLIEPDSDLPKYMIGDMGRIKQILINLVNNAVKFTEQGSIRLIINCMKSENGYMLRMEVIDTGIGIKSDDLNKLFEDFSQADLRHNTGREGTGLGLSICKQLCKIMGGNINVTSEFGKGSSFVVSVFQKVRSDLLLLPPVKKRVHILLFEAVPMVCEYMKRCMDNIGINYKDCNTRKEFIEEAVLGDYTHIMAHHTVFNEIKMKFDGVSIVNLFNLNEHDIIDAFNTSIYMPLFALQITSLLSGEDNKIFYNHSGINVKNILKLPYVSVLIVDDNEVNIKVVEGLMEPYGMKISHAYSGEEAISAIKNEDFDMVFMDYMMPKMDGIETLKLIRELPGKKYKDLVVIAITANIDTNTSEGFLKNGFNGFLAKPIDTNRMDKLFNEWLTPINNKRMYKDGDKQNSVIINKWHLNCEDALKNVGNITTYTKILRTYWESTSERISMLEEWLQNDKERFLVEIHGIKSASASIGADELSDLALSIEKACRTGNYDYALEQMPDFMKHARLIMCEIGIYLGEDIEEDEVSVSELFVADSRKKHITIVDDNPVNLELAENVLKKEYNIKKLKSGEELIEFLKAEDTDMVLLDINMPGMNGYETLDYIRKDDNLKDIPAIFITSQADIASEREGFRLGAKDFIVKPFDNTVMLSRVRSQMELYKYQTELKTLVSQKRQEVESLQHVITVSWAEVIESRDGTTGLHVRNTTRYFKKLLELIRERDVYIESLDLDNIGYLLRASSLHDIGKIGISDLVLKKPGPLTKEEFETMKEHSRIGADMIQKIIDNTSSEPFLTYAYDMALLHHERWDGNGYPMGLKGDEIPFYVQALTITDVFDALTSMRPYKKEFTFEEALEIMCKECGKFYAPVIFDIFISNKEEFRKLLNTK